MLAYLALEEWSGDVGIEVFLIFSCLLEVDFPVFLSKL